MALTYLHTLIHIQAPDPNRRILKEMLPSLQTVVISLVSHSKWTGLGPYKSVGYYTTYLAR